MDHRTDVLPHDFSYHVVGALYGYRVPVQGPSLAVQDTDPQVLRRNVAHLGHVRRVHGAIRRDRPVLLHGRLRNHNTCHNVTLLQDLHEAETEEGVLGVHAADRRPRQAQQRGPSAPGIQANDCRGLATGHLDHQSSALHGRRADCPRAIYVHGGQPRHGIRTFLVLLLTR